MTNLTEKQIEEYFRRSYKAVDGLWFMKIEDRFGFDTAVEVDEAVWKVLPKIQARMIKDMMALDPGLNGLQRAMDARLFLEGYEYALEKNENGLRIIISSCPWHTIMIKSGRGYLSENVSDLICRVENSVWASEFGKIRFEQDERICKGSEKCVMRFSGETDPERGGNNPDA